MRVIDLIRHYERSKSLHQPISKSLGEKLVQLRDAFGTMPASSSGADIVAAARRYWPRAQDNTIKRNLVQLRAVFNVAARDGLLSSVPHIAMPAVFDQRDVQISTEEMGHLLDYIEVGEPGLYLPVLLLMHTGGRLGEVWALEAEDFLVESIRFRKPRARRSKTVERRVPFSARLSDYLLCAGRPVSAPFSRSMTVKSLGHSVRGVLQRATVALGLPDLRVHDLRHCFAALVAANGGDLADIAALLGHSNIGTTMRYRGLVQQKAKSILASVA